MKKSWQILIWSSVIWMGGFAGAAGQQPELSLEEAIRKAKLQNLQLRQQSFLMDAADEEVRQQRADFYPNLQFRTSVSHANEAPRVPIEFQNDTVLARQGTENTFIARFELEQLLYDFGKTRNALSASRNRSRALQYDYSRRIDQLTTEVKMQYYRMLSYQATDSMYAAMIPHQRRLQDIAAKRVQNGVALSPELLKARLEVQRALSDRAVTRSSYLKSRVQLALLMGSEEQFRAVGGLPSLVDTGDMMSYYGTLLQLARTHRSDLDQVEARVSEQHNLARAYAALRYPTLMLQSDFSYFGPEAFGYYSGLSSRGLNPVNWKIGVGFTYTLFNGGRNNAMRKQALAMQSHYKEQLNQLEKQIGAEIRQYLSSLESLREVRQSNEALVEQARASAELSRVSYRNGAIPELEYIRAQLPVAEARITLQETRLQIAEILVQLELTIGADPSTIIQIAK